MFGVGLPVALQKRVWLLPSRTTGLDGAQTITLLSERKVVQEIQTEFKSVYFAMSVQTKTQMS